MATVKGGNSSGPADVAIDSVSSEAIQRVKVTFGDSSTGTRVTSATPLPVDASGAAVPVTDNNGSLTVDGTVAATQSGTWTVQPGNTANTTAWKVDASSVAVPVTDNSGSLTVDNAGTFSVQTSAQVPGTGATNLGKAVDSAVGATDTGVAALFKRVDTPAALTPAANDYTWGQVDANGSLWVSLATSIASTTDSITAVGDVAHDAVDGAGNFPVKVGYQARSSLPTQVASGDRTNGIADLWGRQLTSHVDPAMTTWKHFSATSTAVGHMIWNPAAGKRIAVTNLQIGTTGTVASDLVIWFGDASDTTYTEGTDQVLFDGTFVPSSTAAPGAVNSFAHPVFCTTADRKLRFSMPSSMQTKITVQGYEW